MGVSAGNSEQLVAKNHLPTMRVFTRIRQLDCGLMSAHGQFRHAGNIPHMMKPNSAADILSRIDKRLAALAAEGKKLSDRALSLEATESPDTVRSIRRNVKDGKQRGISTETLAKLAGPLNTTQEWLFNESGPETRSAFEHVESAHVLSDSGAPKGSKQVRIVGYVGAGSVAHYYALSQDDFQTVDAPDGATDQTVAVEVRGKSFGPLMDSWLVFYDDVRSPITPDLINEICVVGLADDRILLKQIKLERDGSFTLLSNSNEPPITDAQIEWAAKVASMRPR